MNDTGPSWAGNLLGGRYRIGRMLGKGGMGAVYEAVQADLGRKVAVKVLHPHLAFHPDALQRFRFEAQSAAALGHPNIVQVTDFQATPGQPPFLVMEFLEGQSLATAIRTAGGFSAQRLAFIVAQMLSGLAAAHRANLVHRDIKPDNVFLTSTTAVSDLVKLLDFGIAKLQGDAGGAELTATGAMIGSPAYMSPEQARGLPIDARTDLYAVGACMYNALSGRMPFHADSLQALLFAIVEQAPPPLSSLCPGIDPVMVSIVSRAMAKDPAARFGSADEMRAALATWSAPTTQPPPAPHRAQISPGAHTTTPPIGHSTTQPVHQSMTSGAMPPPKPSSGGGVAIAIGIGGLLLLSAVSVGGYVMWQRSGGTASADADAAVAAATQAPPIVVTIPGASALPTSTIAPGAARPHGGPTPTSPTPTPPGSAAPSPPFTPPAPTPTAPTPPAPPTPSGSASPSAPKRVARFRGGDCPIYPTDPWRNAMDLTQGPASACFSRFAPPDPNPFFEINVAANGAVTRVGAPDGATAPRNPSLDACMKGVFSGTHLGPPSAAGAYHAFYQWALP